MRDVDLGQPWRWTCKCVWQNLIAMRYTHTLLLAIGLVCLMPVDVLAERGKLKADCIIQIKGTKGGQTRLTVMPGTTPAYVLTPTNLHFVLDLALDETYLLTFEHPNCVTKQLYVDASVPLNKRTGDFDFPLKVVLERHDEPFTYAGPVGFIYYEHGLTDFSYHTEYAININKRFDERMAELERTGVDPRSATLGYTASTSPVTPATAAPPKEETPITPWSTVAPTVAHVAPKVHRLGSPESPASPKDVEVVPAVMVEPRVPELPVLVPVVTQAASALPAMQVRHVDVSAAIDVAPHVDQSMSPSGTAEPRPDFSWELIVEERRLTTVIRLTDEEYRSTEYRRVLHSSGAAYYFQDGRSISEHSYRQGTEMVRDLAITAENDAHSLQ